MTCELGCPKRAIYKGEERILVCSDCYPRIEEASSEEARGVIQRLSDALEAAEQRAEAMEDTARQVVGQRNQLAAVVEKVRDYLEEGKGAYAPDLLDILTTDPADALREHDAKVRAEEREKADREPSERLMVAPAIQAVRDVLNGLEDWEIEDRALEEIRSAVDDIPDCESATAIPHEEHGEPSDAEVEAAADAIVGASFGQDLPEAPIDLARAALLAAQEVRRADNS